MTATTDALNTQGNILSKVVDVVLALLKNPIADKREVEQAQARIAEFVAADEANAAVIEANNARLLELLEAAAAAVMPIPVVEVQNGVDVDDVETESDEEETE
jgi:hypothetical protein